MYIGRKQQGSAGVTGRGAVGCRWGREWRDGDKDAQPGRESRHSFHSHDDHAVAVSQFQQAVLTYGSILEL
jgi:hypothetical protein